MYIFMYRGGIKLHAKNNFLAISRYNVFNTTGEKENAHKIYRDNV